MSKEYLQSEIDALSEAIDSEVELARHPFIRSARTEIAFAQALLDRDIVRTDGTTEKAFTFAFKAHLDSARRAWLMAANEQFLAVGYRVTDGGKKGHEKAYGDNPEQWAKYQRTVDQLHKDDPTMNWTAIKEAAAARHGVSSKCIYRHCKNPIK